MKTIFPIVLTAIFFVTLNSCKVGSQKEIDSTVKKIDSVIVKTDSVFVKKDSITSEVSNKNKTIVKEEVIIEEREPNDEEIREFGIIKNIEDAQYPQFILTIEFPERKLKADFNVNIESISQSVTELNALLGKYVTVYYTDIETTMLMDLHHDGKSLYGENREIDDSYEKFIGVLSGAEEVSGDNPGTISITNKDGKKMSFQEFVTQEIIDKNGETVTAYYYSRFQNNITYLKPSEN